MTSVVVGSLAAHHGPRPRDAQVRVDRDMQLWIDGRLIRDATWEWGESHHTDARLPSRTAVAPRKPPGLGHGLDRRHAFGAGARRAKMEEIGPLEGVLDTDFPWWGRPNARLTDGREFPHPQIVKVKYGKNLRGGFATAKARQLRNASLITRGYTEEDMAFVAAAIRQHAPRGGPALMRMFGYRMRGASDRGGVGRRAP